MAPEGYRNIVIIQLSGANDGLNTVIPFSNDLYYKARKNIAIPQNNVLRLTDQAGFHPVMQGFKELYDEGLLSIINNVGYPEPNRSHFRSMDIWETASGANEYLNTGWIGRYLDSSCEECNNPYLALDLSEPLSLALKGSSKKGIAVNNPKQLYNQTREPFFQELNKHAEEHANENVSYLYKTVAETSASAKYIYETSKTYTNVFPYPNHKLAKQLQQVATFIASGLKTRVYYASMGGFDTHVNQLNRQENLLTELSESVTAFVRNLKSVDQFNDTAVLIFSEFGRRVEQNASGGTDHGTANNVFVIAPSLKKQGLYNNMPDLRNLDDGDLKYTVDFRSIYNTLLNNWLQVESGLIVNKNLGKLAFL
ncbi:MAG: hypothetical protein JWO58_692 [Chitinophagaceae bacterium]|nr:hypothetical protein [Chitinophagaceae bacterium]